MWLVCMFFVGLHQPRSLSFFIFLSLLTAELSDSRLVPEKSSELRRKNAMLRDGGIVVFVDLTIFNIALESLFQPLQTNSGSRAVS